MLLYLLFLRVDLILCDKKKCLIIQNYRLSDAGRLRFLLYLSNITKTHFKLKQLKLQVSYFRPNTVNNRIIANKVFNSIISSKYLQNPFPRMVFGYEEHSDLASAFRSMDLTHWTPYVGYLKWSGLKFYGVVNITCLCLTHQHRLVRLISGLDLGDQKASSMPSLGQLKNEEMIAWIALPFPLFLCLSKRN